MCVTGGLFGARSVVNAEIAAPNSAVNKLDDIFKNNTPKQQAEMVTPNGFRVRIPDTEKPLQTADDLNSKIVTVDGKGNPSGTRFRSDYEDHIKQRDYSNPSQKSGVNGAHNLSEFEQFDISINPAVTRNSIKIISKTPHPTVKGIYNIEYEMPKLDSKLQVTGWRLDSGKPFVKTVYDPNVISDGQMMQWGREAFADAMKKTPAISRTNANLKWEGTASNGLKFKGFVDTKGSEAVRTFFPSF